MWTANLAAAALGLAEDFIGEIRGDGNAETFTLVGLDDQKKPQNNAEEMKEAPEREAEREACHTTGQKTESEDIAENLAEDGEGSENDDGLGGMEADVRALVNEEEDKAGNPAKDVAECAGGIFLKTRLPACSGRSWIVRRLRSTAGRAKRNVVSDRRSAFRAVCHEASPRASRPARWRRRLAKLGKEGKGNWNCSNTQGKRLEGTNDFVPMLYSVGDAEVAELADAPALGAGGRKAVGVRVPSSAFLF